MNVRFGQCYAVSDIRGCPGKTVKYECDNWSGSLVARYWDNMSCKGAPKRVVDGDICHPSRANKANNEECAGNKPPHRRRWYTYSCYYTSLPAGELRAEEEMKMMNTNNLDVGIVAAMLLFVCIFGVIVGYLMHRRRKKKKFAEKKSSLCDASKEQTNI